LRNCQYFPADVGDRSIHLPCFIFKNPQFNDPARQSFGIFIRVLFFNADQH